MSTHEVGPDVTRIVIADDHPAVREGLKRIIDDSDGLEVVGEAGTTQQAIEIAERAEPDVVMLDISMPGRGALDTLKTLKKQRDQIRVLILSMHPEDQYAVRFLREGADGYLTKDSAPQLLVQALRKVANGGKYVSASLAETLASRLGMDYDRPAHDQLSDREYQVLCMIGNGKTVKAISAELELSPKTVSTYRRRILEKMDLSSTAEIMHYALKRGLAVPQRPRPLG